MSLCRLLVLYGFISISPTETSTVIFFLMTLYKCLAVIRRSRWNSFDDSTSVLHMFAKDGVIYFLLSVTFPSGLQENSVLINTRSSY